MSTLELKIPPLLLMVMIITLMWFVAQWLPNPAIPLAFKIIGFFNFVGLGLMFIGSAGISFKKANTTLNPMNPDTSSTLVTSDLYEVSRNPMYLGILFILIGCAVFLSNAYALALSVGFVWYMNRFQILPEERVLQTTFGDGFLTYKGKVHRWL